MNPVRLLLVEDDAVSRGFLTLALQSLPATVVDTATNATQALAHAHSRSHEQSHALWLLDANLPDASGEQLLRALRDVRPDVPAICLTAEIDQRRLDRLRAAGFVAVLQKPLSIAALHAAVRHVLGMADQAGHADPPVWDDAQALQALGGNPAAMRAMRGLFVAELPLQAAAILRAIAADDAATARSELHKLKASCGFVGSPRLFEAIRALADAPEDSRCAERFREQVDSTLATAQSES